MDSLTASILTGLHVLLAVGLVTLILLQQGQGAGMGAAFGSGASGTVFGSRGSASFLTKTTAVIATIFFLNSIALAYLAINRPDQDVSVLERVEDSTGGAPGIMPGTGEGDVPTVPGNGGTGQPAGSAGADVPDIPVGEAPGSGAGDVPAPPEDTGSRSQ